jgi:hypothetical protein
MEEVKVRHKVVTFLFAILAVSSISFGEENLHFEREKAAWQSSCLLEGTDEYSVHLFKGGLHQYTDGYVISHINYKTNKITWLYCSGLYEEPTVALGSYSINKIRGILIHNNYLYILVYESGQFSADKRPDQYEQSSYSKKVALKGRLKMMVFNNKSAQKVGEYTYAEPLYKPSSFNFLDFSTCDHLGDGPISINDKSIECLGVIFKIEGNELISLNPSTAYTNTGPLVLSIKDVNMVPQRITLALEFKTQEGQVLLDTYFPEYYISFNNTPFVYLGTISWRHPFNGEDLKTISLESPHIMTYYFDIPYSLNKPEINIEEIKTVKMRMVCSYRNGNDKLAIEVLEQSGHEDPNLYKKAWIGQATSQEYIIKKTTD